MSINLLKNKATILLLIMVAALTPVFLPKHGLAIDCNQSTQNAIQCGTNAAGGTSDSSQSSSSLQDTVKALVEVLSIAAGIIAVVMIIIGGIRYITSAGNPEATKSARNTILYAIIGLVVVAVAQVVVHFTLNTAAGACVDGKTPSGQKC